MKNIPYSQKIFGSVAYWLSIVCAILALIVTVLILTVPEQNVLHPGTAFEMIFDGATHEEIWAYSEIGEFPGGHFYLNNVDRVDSWAMIIIVIGSAFGLFALVPAVLYQLFKEKDWFSAGLGIVIMLLVSLSAFGVLN